MCVCLASWMKTGLKVSCTMQATADCLMAPSGDTWITLQGLMELNLAQQVRDAESVPGTEKSEGSGPRD